MNKYEIAKMVALEEFMNCMENMDLNPENYTKEQIEKMFEEFEEKLSNDDIYNGIYNETLYAVVNKNRN